MLHITAVFRERNVRDSALDAVSSWWNCKAIPFRMKVEQLAIIK
jgi:hypothetical protein